MPIQSFGDMSQHFQSLNQTGRIKSDLMGLSTELSTQQKSDLTEHLHGATSQVSSLDREISILEGYERAATEIGQRLSFMQSTLDGIDQMRGRYMQQALPISADSSNAAIQDAADAGHELFRDIALSMNKRIGDRALFSGVASDQDALASPDDMLASIQLAVAGLTDAVDIKNAVETWFEDPAGGFATMGYLGDQGGPLEQSIGSGSTVEISARADDNAIRSLLKGAALASIAADDTVLTSQTTRADLVRSAGQEMLAGSEPLTNMRGALGYAEGRIAEVSVAQATQLTAYRINRNDLTVADPFETATRLQDVQQQLEMHYTVTARLSQLSLVNFLR